MFGIRERRAYITDYDMYTGRWWEPRGPLVALSWLARSRGELIPPAARPGTILLDVACGGGLLHPHVRDKGYRHLGVDLSDAALSEARDHGVHAVLRSTISKLPIGDETVDVVVAGHCLEHVPDQPAVIAECCRVLRPGGLLVVDTIADTSLARLVTITIGERLPLPAMPPRGCHDPRLLVNRARLVTEAHKHGVDLRLGGVLPRLDHGIAWLLRKRPDVRFFPTKNTAVFLHGVGRKRHARVTEGS
jgi:2-polyprenyl-6-hydroxyphenyl methylase/3-demethylubiquinone-9 3-methyltransferase